MGFFSDFGSGIASIIKAPFEGVGSLVRGVGEGVGAILGGASGSRMAPYQYMGSCAQQCQGQDPNMAMQMLNMQNALMLNMALYHHLYCHSMCGRPY